MGQLSQGRYNHKVGKEDKDVKTITMKKAMQREGTIRYVLEIVGRYLINNNLAKLPFHF